MRLVSDRRGNCSHPPTGRKVKIWPKRYPGLLKTVSPHCCALPGNISAQIIMSLICSDSPGLHHSYPRRGKRSLSSGFEIQAFRALELWVWFHPPRTEPGIKAGTTSAPRRGTGMVQDITYGNRKYEKEFSRCSKQSFKSRFRYSYNVKV